MGDVGTAPLSSSDLRRLLARAHLTRARAVMMQERTRRSRRRSGYERRTSRILVRAARQRAVFSDAGTDATKSIPPGDAA